MYDNDDITSFLLLQATYRPLPPVAFPNPRLELHCPASQPLEPGQRLLPVQAFGVGKGLEHLGADC